MSDNVERCFRAKPIESVNMLCNCNLYTSPIKDSLTNARWMDKPFQECLEKRRDICCCKQIDDHYDLMD